MVLQALCIKAKSKAVVQLLRDLVIYFVVSVVWWQRREMSSCFSLKGESRKIQVSMNIVVYRLGTICSTTSLMCKHLLSLNVLTLQNAFMFCSSQQTKKKRAQAFTMSLYSRAEPQHQTSEDVCTLYTYRRCLCCS